MRRILPVRPRQTLIGRLPHGGDLLEEITKICIEEGVRLGTVSAIGAVQRARLGYYLQREREYQFFTLNEPLEIASLSGNVSLKDKEPFVHAHALLSDGNGRTFGGHLAPGTVIFACEVVIASCEGTELEREADDATGLPLWK